MEPLSVDPGMMRWIWIGGGVLLVLLEFAIPGLVVIFFGVGAILTGVLVAFGLLDTLTSQFMMWILASAVLFFGLRGQIQRWFPALERYVPPADNLEILGSVAQVIETITPDEPGRVRFQGTTWKAVSRSTRIEAGQTVKITGRDNLILYVQPLSGDEA